MRKSIVFILAAPALFGPLLTFFFLPTNRQTISNESLKRVTVGMTRHDVERLLRAQAGDYSGGIGTLLIPDGLQLPDGQSIEWLGQDNGIRVWFNEQNIVTFVFFGDVVSWIIDTNLNNDPFLTRLLNGRNPFVRPPSGADRTIKCSK